MSHPSRLIQRVFVLAAVSAMPFWSTSARGQHGGGHGGVGMHGVVGGMPQASGSLGPANGHYPRGTYGYAYGVIPGYGYGADSFTGMGMTLDEQMAVKQARWAAIVGQAQLEQMQVQLAYEMAQLARQQAVALARLNEKASGDRAAAQGSKVPLSRLIALDQIRWPALPGLKSEARELRLEADEAIREVHNQVLSKGVADPQAVLGAKMKLRLFREAATKGPKSKSNVQNRKRLAAFVLAMDEALNQSLRSDGPSPATADRDSGLSADAPASSNPADSRPAMGARMPANGMAQVPVRAGR